MKIHQKRPTPDQFLTHVQFMINKHGVDDLENLRQRLRPGLDLLLLQLQKAPTLENDRWVSDLEGSGYVAAAMLLRSVYS